jgi:outer membrane protein assembly factor BamD (BamD/ComL family)
MKKSSKFIALLLMATISLTSCKDKKESKADDKNDKTSSVGNTSTTNTSENNLESDAVRLAALSCNFVKAKASGDTALIMRIDKEGQALLI